MAPIPLAPAQVERDERRVNGRAIKKREVGDGESSWLPTSRAERPLEREQLGRLRLHDGR